VGRAERKLARPAPTVPPERAAPGRRGLRPLALFLALSAALLLVYAPALDGGIVWDDADHLPKPEFYPLSGLGRIWFEFGAIKQYYPLTYSLFWLQHHLWGGGLVGVHVTNVLLHALNATLVFVLLRRLAAPGALLAAAVFAFHPVHVESVAWMSELKNVLSGALFLTALLLWLAWARPGAGAPPARRAWWLALGCFTLALLSKAVTATWPGVALTVLWWRDGRIAWRRDVVPLLPFFGVAIAAGAFSAWMEKHQVGAQGEVFDLSASQRFVLAGRALWFYAAQLAWPADLCFSYPRWEIDASAALAWAAPLGVLAVIAAAWAARARLGRGPLAGVLVFCGTLFPALGFVDVFPFQYSFVADHFQYLASLGLIALGAGAAAHLAGRRFAGRERAVQATAGLLLALLAAQSWRTSRMYEDMETLWRETVARNPSSWMGHSNLGVELARQGRHAEALACYQAALAVDPARAWTRFNLANALDVLGRREEAVAEYRRALADQPDAFEFHNNLAGVLEKQGDVEGALRHYRRALEIEPRFATAHFNLGATLARQDELEEAIACYERAIAAAPRYAAPENNLGIALARLGRPHEAIPHFERALALQLHYPEAHNNLGMALAQIGELERAERHFQTALRQRPGYTNAEENLRRLQAQRRQGAGGG
jgi:tetratricopeptide (TPR) repeat protein